jgi:hypothetical protein
MINDANLHGDDIVSSLKKTLQNSNFQQDKKQDFFFKNGKKPGINHDNIRT